MGALRTGLEAARPNGTGCVVPDSDCLNKDRLHLRVLLDLKMILCHRSVTAHLLLHQPEALRVFLDSMQLMQATDLNVVITSTSMSFGIFRCPLIDRETSLRSFQALGACGCIGTATCSTCLRRSLPISVPCLQVSHRRPRCSPPPRFLCRPTVFQREH